MWPTAGRGALRSIGRLGEREGADKRDEGGRGVCGSVGGSRVSTWLAVVGMVAEVIVPGSLDLFGLFLPELKIRGFNIKNTTSGPMGGTEVSHSGECVSRGYWPP